LQGTPQASLAGRERRRDGEQARNDPLDIAIQDRDRLAERNRRDRRRSVRADARQPGELRSAGGKSPAMFTGNRAGAGKEVSGA
jgi:hypothetical protein